MKAANEATTSHPCCITEMGNRDSEDASQIRNLKHNVENFQEEFFFFLMAISVSDNPNQTLY